MSEPEVVDEALRWLRYAREDLAAAESSFAQRGMVPRHACWLAQQAAEKTLKAVLIFLQLDFPRTHDLDTLRNLLPEDWRLKKHPPDLADLAEWAVEARYPGEWPEPTDQDARSAVQRATAIWECACADLARQGLDPGADE